MALIDQAAKTFLALLLEVASVTMQLFTRSIGFLAYTFVSRPVKTAFALLLAGALVLIPVVGRGIGSLKEALAGRVEILAAFLLAAALATIQVLIGGTRLLFSFPAYGLLAVMGLLSVFSLRRPKPEPNQLCLISTALFFGYILARALLSPVDYIARTDIYSVLGGLLIYFFVACIFTASKRRIMLLIFLVALGMAHVFIGAIQFRHGTNFMPIPFLQRYDYGLRASGFYVCPNHLAGLLEVLGIIGLSISCWSRAFTWGKLLTGYAVGVCYLGVLLTGSRGGYLATATSAAVFGLLSMALLRKGPGGVFWKIGATGLIVAAITGLGLVFLLHKSDYLSGRAQKIFATTDVRVDMWKAATDQWKLQPVFGTGSGTYLFYGRQFRTERMQRDPVYAHNDYLQLLAEYGLVGTALFFVFLGSHLWNGWKNFQRLGPKRVGVSHQLTSGGMALEIGALSAVGAYIVHSVFDFNLHIPANVLLLALVFGILANAGTQREKDSASVRSLLVGWRLLLPLIGLIMAVQCVRLLPGEYFTERARTAIRDDQPASAILFALRGLSWEQKNPNLYQYLGNARAGLGDTMSDPRARLSFYEAAIRAFEQGRMLAPLDRNFAIELASVYDELGRFAEAEGMFNEALRLDPKSESIRLYYEAHLDRWERWLMGERQLPPDSE